jgi:hypothetical protein
VLAGHEEDVAEPAVDQGPPLLDHLLRRQRPAGDVVAGGEAAVGARRHALVRHVQRGEEAHGPAEALDGEAVRGGRQVLEPLGRRRGEEDGEVVEAPPGPAERPLDVGRGGRVDPRPQGGDVGGEEVGGGGVRRDASWSGLEGHRGGGHGAVGARNPVRGDEAAAAPEAAGSPAR